MKPGKSYHFALDIDASHRRYGRLVTVDGKPVTAYEFERLRGEYKARGFAVFPPCDSIDERGRCAGHTNSRQDDADGAT